MKKKIMGLILIIVGIAIIVAGIVLISRNNKNQQTLSSVRQERSHASADYLTKSSTSLSVTDNSNVSASGSNDSETLSAKEKGDLFENFAVNLLADWRLKLLERTQDKMSSAGVVAESSKNPDLHVQQKRGKYTVDYYLECKYRSNWHDDAVTFEDWQIKRYRDFQRNSHRKVIIALGVGGTPSNPATLMLVPIDSIKENSIKKAWLSRYAIQPNTDALVSYIDNYFGEVFSVARQRKEK